MLALSYECVSTSCTRPVGVRAGKFGPGEFSLELTGLSPGGKYEFVAEAANSFGFGSGQAITFTMNYGKTAPDAVDYLASIGMGPSGMADILVSVYDCSLSDAFRVLLDAGYSPDDVVATAKVSSYKAKYTEVADVLTASGFSAQDLSRLLIENYKNEMHVSVSSGGYEWALIMTLRSRGFALSDMMAVMVSLFGYNAQRCDTQFRTSSLYANDERYSAIIQVLGLEALLDHLWAQSMESVGRYGLSRIYWYLGDLSAVARDNGGVGPTETADILKGLYPSLDADLLLKAYDYAKYPVEETVSALIHLFGPEPLALAAILNQSTYDKNDINRCLIQDLGYSAIDMVRIITYVYRNWKAPQEACALILKEYFGLSAPESAKVLYSAGWTEKVSDAGGYGLGQLIYTMERYYGETSDYALIGILKGLGLSPLEVAKRVGGKAGWLTDYRAWGYTAADSAQWVRSAYASYGLSSQLGATVQFCDAAGYDLADIARALLVVYEADMSTALKYLVANTKKDTDTINEVLAQTYGSDPIVSAVAQMKEAGESAIGIASSLRYTYKVGEPESAATYMTGAGVSARDTLQALGRIYFDTRAASGFGVFMAFANRVFPALSLGDILSAVILEYAEPDPTSVVYLLRVYGYGFETISKILKEEFGVPLFLALRAITQVFGPTVALDVIPVVMLEYGLDIVSYIEYERLRGSGAVDCAKKLRETFGVGTIGEAGGILATAGYTKDEVLHALLDLYYGGRHSAEATETIAKVLQDNYGAKVNEYVRALLEEAGAKEVHEVESILRQSGFGLDDVVLALKDIYLLAEGEVVGGLTDLRIYGVAEISVAVQDAYGGDYVLMAIDYWRSEGRGAGSVYGSLVRDLGISEPAAVFRYMRRAGYTEYECIDALYWAQREGTYQVLRAIYQDGYLVPMIRYLGSRGLGTHDIYRDIYENSGTDDHAVLFAQMRAAGYEESECVLALYSRLRLRMVPVLKEAFDLQDAQGMAAFLRPYYKDGSIYLYSKDLADQFAAVFPGISHYDIVRAFLAMGLEVETTGSDSVEGWLRTYATNGVHDDDLAAYLGRNNDGLGFPAYIATQILYGKGYVVEDAIYWLLQCGYDWEQFYRTIVAYYAPQDFPTSYYENNSSSKFIVQYLKPYYDIRDIARGEYGMYNSASFVLADLISGGYGIEEAVFATIWVGGAAVGDMVAALVSNSISRANAGDDPGLRLNAVTAASIVFDVSLFVTYSKREAGIPEDEPIGLTRIAQSLVENGPDRGAYRYFSAKEMLEAMETITRKHLILTGSDMPVRETALAVLRTAGLSPSSAAQALAEYGVGLSLGSVFKSIFGLGSDWFDAILQLAGAGYSFEDSISAIFENQSYKTVIGLGVLSFITTGAISRLSESAQIAKLITDIKRLAGTGFMIAEGRSLDDILVHLVDSTRFKFIDQLVYKGYLGYKKFGGYVPPYVTVNVH